jgi:hypothetical protein
VITRYGCLVHGRQSTTDQIREITNIARDAGWVDSDPTGTDGIFAADNLDEIIELGDECEVWLNEHVANAGSAFGWWEGEFWFMPTTWWEENG